MPERCPDFELADPVQYDAAVLLPVDGEPKLLRQTKELMLLLAVAFNDIKMLAWIDEQLNKGRPVKGERTPYAGQWSGAAEWLERISSGLVHELYLRVPAHADHRFRSKPITHSGGRRSPIPEQADR